VGFAAVREDGIDVGLIFGVTHLSILLKIAGRFNSREQGLLVEAEGVHLRGIII
jgi:hypothetical protein